MKNPSKPIYPLQDKGRPSRVHVWDIDTLHGLTKREYAAIMAMQGLLSSYSGDVAMPDDQTMSKWAVSLADALFEELEK